MRLAAALRAGSCRVLLAPLIAACSGASASPGVSADLDPRPTACELERSAAVPAVLRVAPGPTPLVPVVSPPSPAAPVDVCTPIDALPAAPGATEADDRRLREGRVLVAHKSLRRMMLYDAGELVACWKIALGFSPQGHKRVEGDGRTPEGWYRTSDKPWSYFDDAIAIHYPATRDADAALADGRIDEDTHGTIARATGRGAVPPQRTAMGGEVLIHGGGNSRDWTLGCIALRDEDLQDLRNRLPEGMRTDLLVVD